MVQMGFPLVLLSPTGLNVKFIFVVDASLAIWTSSRIRHFVHILPTHNNIILNEEGISGIFLQRLHLPVIDRI